jgi:hypothetical protein
LVIFLIKTEPNQKWSPMCIYIFKTSKSQRGHIIGRLGKDKFKFYKHSGEGNKVIKKSQQPALC